ncbi:hypothetical protein E3U55_10435 [Filobacillus milosensis]|uniref:Uncharacterized protein n=1 Tax=Filobacillus milosensis TaxID=94137 RepID=A0A4Y8IMV7_9BACI|nr:hypothetical protein [Filobacillus milosensis]TFB19570.1 hypothetical protein E3U55_10435 [Filobacillus milosensis]
MWLRATLIVLVVLGAFNFMIRMLFREWEPVLLILILATISIIGYLEDDNVEQKEARLGVSLGLSLYLPYVIQHSVPPVIWMQRFDIVFYYVLPAVIFLVFQSMLYRFDLTNR